MTHPRYGLCRTLVEGARRVLILGVAATGAALALSCGDAESSKGGDPGGASAPASAAVVPAGAARIVAEPNPVPAGPGLGTTTITWDTGGSGMNGQVYVAVGSGPEELFAEIPKGSKTAPWVGSGSPYEFRLYAGKDHKKRLATVTVTREKSGQG